jgi:pyruvate dehydrogenase E2 component (dihydrolipoamide acetyltransferase)
VSVETEKAVVEIPSPKAGHIAKFLVRVGERVKVGAPLLSFEEGPHAETGTVVGELAKAGPGPRRPSAPTIESLGVARASPAVRARARELGVDLARVMPSGPDGTLTRADVEAAATITRGGGGGGALRGARRTMALNMARAWREVAHATLHDEADIEAWAPQEDVTCRLVRALIGGCRAEPSLNACFDSASMSMRPNDKINIGLAIDSPDGLFVPVLHDIAAAGPQTWRARIEAAKKGVKERSLAAEDFRGATITLSNFGTIAGQHAALVVMPPQVAIMGAGRITDRLIRTDGQPLCHRKLPLSLTFDHRAVTGGEAARFMRAVIIDLQHQA